MPSPSDCVFSDSHEWHRVAGDTLTLGISRYAVDALTDVTYVNIKAVGTKVAPGGSVGEVESVKTSSDIYSAIPGEIIEINKAVIDDPSRLNADPFANWLVILRVTDVSAVAKLMNAGAYDSKYPTA
jgi:glycine cleavage system H protein